MMARKVHVCIKNWEFHLVTPPKCQKLPSSITKATHVKFRATSNSLPSTLSWYYRGQNKVVVMKRCDPCWLERSWDYQVQFPPIIVAYAFPRWGSLRRCLSCPEPRVGFWVLGRGYYVIVLRASPPLGRKAGSQNALWRAPSMHWIFLGWHSPTVTCILALQPGLFSKNCQKYYMIPKSGTIHWIASGWSPGMWAQLEQRSPARIVSGAGRLKSPGNQGRRIGEGWDTFFSKAASKGLPRPLTRQGGDALSSLPQFVWAFLPLAEMAPH